MENREKKLDEFTKKIFRGNSLETPSFDFTDKVMANLPEFTMVKAARVSPSVNKIKFEPLISKKGWVMIVAFIALLLTTSYFSSAEGASEAVIDNWSTVKSVVNFSLKLPNISILNSDVIAISVVLFTACFLLEIFLLNNWISKRKFY